MKILHIITSCMGGGAETMLHRLLSTLDRERFPAEVIALGGAGSVAHRIEALGVPVHLLHANRSLTGVTRILGLVSRIRAARPDVVQTWLYHADMVGGLAARLSTRAPVIWNLRHTPDAARDPRRLQWTLAALARLSGSLPARIICCSETTREAHIRLGYQQDRMVVIPNGFETDRYRPDPSARAALRREWNLSDDTTAIGIIGRYHPQKDHRTFALAAGRMTRNHPDVRFILCGGGISSANRELVDLLRDSGIADRCVLLGRREDVHRVHAALDILCSSASNGEGFPNVVGEAMLSGVPCVVTDVGESARIVGDTGRTAPPARPERLAEALQELVALGQEGRRSLGERARRRILDSFSLETIADRYARCWTDVFSGKENGEMYAVHA